MSKREPFDFGRVLRERGALGSLDESTVGAYRDVLEEDIKTALGAVCACCQQRAKVYVRSLNYSQAVGLIWLVRMHAHLVAISDVPPDQVFVNVWDNCPPAVVRGREFDKMHHLAMIVPSTHAAGGRPHWRPTPYGIEVALGRAAFPARYALYADRLIRVSRETTTIRSHLPATFDYELLMSSDVTSLGDSITTSDAAYRALKAEEQALRRAKKEARLRRRESGGPS